MRNKMIVAAGILVLSVAVLSGCSKKELVVNTSEVLSEVVSEAVSETPEEPVAEEPSFLESLPLTNDDGSVYYAVVTEDQLQAKIDEICNMATSDYERDCMISALISLNADCMSHALILKYETAYCDNLNPYDLNYIIMEWNYGKEEMPLSFYFIDEKTAEGVDKFEEMMENKEYDIEDVKATYLDMMNKKYGGRALDVAGIPMGNLYEYCFYYSGIIPCSEGYGSLSCSSYGTQTAFAYFDVEPTPIDEYVSSYKE